MVIHLPEELERFVRDEVNSGRYPSEDDTIADALRLLRQRRPIDSAQPISEQQFEQKLRQSGFLAGGSAWTGGASPAEEIQPINIQGEPLSETIIRERR